MAAITTTCQKCSKQFLIIDQEQQFLSEKGLPNPVQCPACRQERRLALRGGRQLFRAKCQKCNKDIVTSYDPATATSIILCREDYEKYNAETDLIVNEPLPEVPGASTSAAPLRSEASPLAERDGQAPVGPQPPLQPQPPVPQTPEPTTSGNIMGPNPQENQNQ